MAEIELHKVPGWSAEHVSRAALSWISSAEQVVAISVTSGGVQSLAEQLAVSTDEAQRLVHLARAALSPESRTEMGQRFESNDRGMGARSPEEEGGNAPNGNA
jgi:hypothetical protein